MKKISSSILFGCAVTTAILNATSLPLVDYNLHVTQNNVVFEFDNKQNQEYILEKVSIESTDDKPKCHYEVNMPVSVQPMSKKRLIITNAENLEHCVDREYVQLSNLKFIDIVRDSKSLSKIKQETTLSTGVVLSLKYKRTYGESFQETTTHEVFTIVYGR